MKIIVNEKIVIFEATPQVKEWCKNNLIISNPEYLKLERMGKWTGNTPQTIKLYEYHNTYIDQILLLPFGYIADVWKMHPYFSDWVIGINPIEKRNYCSNINLYEYQSKAVEAALKKKNGILVMPCGAGKTQTGLEIISRIGGKALWLTHTQDLLNQSKKRAESVLEIDGTFGTITAGKADVGTHITFATVQTLSKLDLSGYCNEFDIVIVDECFPAGTKIMTKNGEKELQNLIKGDIIVSYNREKRILEYKAVKHLFKIPAHNIVKVKLSNGKEMVTTSNHPFFTKNEQWVNAEKLRSDDYVMQLLWTDNRLGENVKNKLLQKPKKRIRLLLQRMCSKGGTQKYDMDRRTQKSIFGDDEENKREVQGKVFGKNEKKQPYVEERNKGKSFKKVKGNRSSPQNKMWEWLWIDSPSARVDDSISEKRRSVCGISDSYEDEQRERISNLLQSGYSVTKRNDSNRSRWWKSLCSREKNAGRKERQFFEWVRVESVEVQEQTSDGRFNGLCEDGYVYNIEVEDNNNYFANGILVHNCQHCAGTPQRVTQFYKVMSSLSARYKIGLTATPKRADGLEKSMFAILGDVIHEVSREEVAEKTCKVVIKTVETNYMPNMTDILTDDGIINYAALIDDLINDEDRFKKVLEVIENLDGSAIVLANRVLYLQKLNKAYSGKSVCLSGMGYTQKAKSERKAALENLKNGDLPIIFSTYALAAEGLDCPTLKYIVFATPEKNPTLIEQSVGRVMRKAINKEYGTVIDFVDEFPMYKKWHNLRKSVYKKLEI